ncbi:MAG: protein kinase [Aggregatilineales bacterium]
MQPIDNYKGRKIRGYRLDELIGEGGFGVVYRAYQDVIEREVVIKAILPIYANDPGFIRNFEAEAHLVARLEHPNIVPLYDYWREPDGAFLVMRYLRGGSLLDKFKRGILWDLDTVARILEQIAGALSVAHRNDVVHQDIKPANILLDEDNNAYLTDFGIAIDLANSQNLAAMGDENVIHGSPAYIAPEQIKREEITMRADIYSLGIVLYELLAGAHPFENSGLMELLKHQTDTVLPSLQEYRPELPEELNTVIWKATEKLPGLRYVHVTEMAEEFRKITNSADYVPAPSPVRSTGFPMGGGRAKGSITSVINLNAGPANPYKGLRPFQEGDASDFHGRDELIGILMNHIAISEGGSRFLAVVGPSGSGKSSVVRAGLLPKIRRSVDSDWSNSFIVDMTPGNEPLKELENALLKVAVEPDADIITRMTTSTRGLLESVNAVLPQDSSELLLVIDQFEEIFTLTTDEEKRKTFLNNIYSAAHDPLSRLRIIITLRADFYDRPLLYSGIGDLIRNNTEVVLPLSPDELREAVVEPAQRVGLVLENGLIERIIDDVARQPGSLPLLQYTLTELYEQRDNLRLTLEAYDKIGGITGALARRADQLFERLTDEEQAATRQLFLRLVNIGEGTEDTRRRAKQSELNTLISNREMMRGVIEEFGKFRLLSFDNDPTTRTPTVEVAHEALIRRWMRLREWINESRDALREQRKLATATGEWVTGERKTTYLATGARLSQFEDLLNSRTLALSEDERAFILASVNQRERNTRLRRAAVAGLTILTVIALIFGGVAAYQSIQAAQARDDAIVERDRADQESIISRSRELAASALVSINQIDLPLLLGVYALDTANTFEARNSLLTALQSEPRIRTLLHGHTDTNRAVAYSPDGSLIASGGQDNTIIIWDTATNQPVGEPFTGHRDWINTIAFSPDGTMLASGGEDNTIILWDVSTREAIGDPITGQNGEIWSVAFSPDGTMLASGSADATIALWNVESREAVIPPITGHTDIVYAVVFNPDGTRLASGSADTTVRIWDISELENITSETLTGHTNWVFAVAFSPDGQTLASSSADTSIRFWDVATNTPIGTSLAAHTDWVRSIVFSPAGRRVVTSGEDARVLIWDVATQRPISGFFNVEEQDVWQAIYSPDGTTIAVAGDGETISLWSSQAQLALGERLIDHQELVLSTAISPDSTIIATAGGIDADTGIRLWDAETNTLREVLNQHLQPVTSLAFDPSGSYLASGSADQTVIVWSLETSRAYGMIQVTDAVFSVAYTPDGNTLAIGDNDGNITLWNVSGTPEEWQNIATFSDHTDRVVSLDFNQDVTLLASGSRDRTIRLWDITTMTASGGALTGHTEGVESVAFSPDGTRLASGSRDFSVRLWDVASHTLIGEPLILHSTFWILGVAFSPDGKLLASASGDTTIILWDTENSRVIGEPFEGHSDWVNTLAFSPDGNYMVSGGRDSQVIKWAINLEDWRTDACQIANRNLTAEEVRNYFAGERPADICETITE